MGDRRPKHDAAPSPWRPAAEERDYGSLPAGIFLFALVGAAASTAAVGQVRRTVGWFYTQLSRSESYASWEDIPRQRNRSNEAWSRYYRSMRERSEDERERVERIRRMQNVFKKERRKYKDYEAWSGHGPSNYQHYPRGDWYWNAEAHYANQRTNFRSTPRETLNYSMLKHYSVLGLDRSRLEPFSDAEIKDAFRRKAMECHPDQNQNNKEAAEAKFKDIMVSYEAIKSERQNGSC